MKQSDLLDECKEKLDITSDYALASKLKIPRMRISDYRSERVSMDEYAYFVIGDVLGKSPAYLMACVLAENHKNIDKRMIFKDFLTRVGLWIILAVIPVSYVSFSESVQAAGKPVVSDIKAHYAKSVLNLIGEILAVFCRYFTCNWTRTIRFAD